MPTLKHKRPRQIPTVVAQSDKMLGCSSAAQAIAACIYAVGEDEFLLWEMSKGEKAFLDSCHQTRYDALAELALIGFISFHENVDSGTTIKLLPEQNIPKPTCVTDNGTAYDCSGPALFMLLKLLHESDEIGYFELDAIEDNDVCHFKAGGLNLGTILDELFELGFISGYGGTATRLKGTLNFSALTEY